MKAIRLLTAVFFVMAGFFLLAGQNQSLAQRVDKADSKDNWILHAKPDTTGYYDTLQNIPHFPDLLFTGNPVSTHWVQLYIGLPENCWNEYHCYDWIDSDHNGLVSPCDTLYLEWYEHRNGPVVPPSNWWMHVKEVTKTLTLAWDSTHQHQTPPPPDFRLMFAEFIWGWSHYGDQWEYTLDHFPVGETLHVVWPEQYYSRKYHIFWWWDNGDGVLSVCDTIALYNEAPPHDSTTWHVESVATDVIIDAHDYIRLNPTMTQWGIIILVVLIVTSGVFILLRRRKAAVPA